MHVLIDWAQPQQPPVVDPPRKMVSAWIDAHFLCFFHNFSYRFTIFQIKRFRAFMSLWKRTWYVWNNEQSSSGHTEEMHKYCV